MTKKLEVLANISVIVIAILVGTVLVKRYWLPPSTQGTAQASPSNPSTKGVQTGTRITLPGIDWRKSSRTLLLVLSTNCRFCTESAPFYVKLQDQKSSDVRIVAVLPQPIADAKTYLDKLGVRVSEVAQSDLRSVGVSGTPTVLMINKEGVVTDSWVGKLSDDAAARVINLVNTSVAQ